MVMKVLQSIISDILTVVYQQLGCAILLAVMFMFIYLFAKERGWKKIFIAWKDAWKKQAAFRRIFLLAVYVAIVLLITLLNREIWENPLSDVLGTWGLYNKKGKLTTEVIENLLMFVPFPILMFAAFRDKLLKSVKLHDILWTSIKISFLFSAGIEVAQLLFRLGTFQLSDLFYNTLGGILGGLCYCIGCKLKKEK